MSNRQVKVVIEEILTKEIMIDIPDNIQNGDETKYALNDVLDKYKKEEIVLSADDKAGPTEFTIIYPEQPTIHRKVYF